MDDKIEVNDYVRTDFGIIGKVIKVLSNRVFLDNLGYAMLIKDIVKHSKELKDLIECGDLIIYRLRGLKHQCKGFIRIYKDARSGKENLGIDNHSLEQIEIIKILTHEQIEANCYKVGGEDE